MSRIYALLARIERKLGAQPGLAAAPGPSPARGARGGACAPKPRRVMWEEVHACDTDVPPPGIVEIAVALAERHKRGQAFGPIENAALTFIARLTGSEAPVRTVVVGECDFLFPSVSFDGSQKGLRCWLGIDWPAFPAELRAELLEENVLRFHACELPGATGVWPKQFRVDGTIGFQLELRAAEPVGQVAVRQALASLYAQFHHQGKPASARYPLAPASFKVISTETPQ
jgi:hypothetical protein